MEFTNRTTVTESINDNKEVIEDFTRKVHL